MSKEQNRPGIERRRFCPYPEYKDSGLEWQGKIPANWKARRLKYLSRIIMGQSPPSDIVNTLGEGLPFLQGNADFGTEHPTARTFCPHSPKVAAPADILISVRAPVGAINSADREYGIGRGLCAIRPFIQQLEHRYCSYSLQTVRSQLDSIATGSTYDAVSADDVSCLMLYLPSIEEQHRISNFLDRETANIDALIEKKEQLIELLEEKRTALISRAVTKGLDPTVSMKDSGVEWLGRIPAHWDIYALRRKLFRRPGSIKIGPFGSALKLEFMTHEGFKVYGQEHVIARDFNRGNKYIDPAKFSELAACEIRPRDIVVTMMGSSGRCTIVPDDIERGIMDSHLLRIRLPDAELQPRFLGLLIDEAEYVIEQIGAAGKGAIMHGLNSGIIKSIVLAAPPTTEQFQILAFLDRETAKIDALISKIHEAIERLKEYRTALIFAAVTGKIDVRDTKEPDLT